MFHCFLLCFKCVSVFWCVLVCSVVFSCLVAFCEILSWLPMFIISVWCAFCVLLCFVLLRFTVICNPDLSVFFSCSVLRVHGHCDLFPVFVMFLNVFVLVFSVLCFAVILEFPVFTMFWCNYEFSIFQCSLVFDLCFSCFAVTLVFPVFMVFFSAFRRVFTQCELNTWQWVMAMNVCWKWYFVLGS